MAPDSPHDPPFRADHVGSLLRPPESLKARIDRASGKISAGELRAVGDSSIRDAIAFQESVGLQSVTDGEYRREIFYSDFYFRGLGGGMVGYDPSSIDEVYFIGGDAGCTYVQVDEITLASLSDPKIWE